MVTNFSELQLVDDFWKVERFAVIKYPNWTKELNKSNDVDTLLKHQCDNRDDDKSWADKPKPKKRKDSTPPKAGVLIYEIDDDEVAWPNENNCSNGIGSAPPRLMVCLLTRRILNLMKNVTIPPPSIAIPEMSKTSPTSIGNKPNSKMLQVKDGVTTARNLYLIEYLAMHPDASKAEFASMWKACDAVTKK
ncbi:hypothetical protein C0992_001992, partial [Termitomyces sp. T32_za158]